MKIFRLAAVLLLASVAATAAPPAAHPFYRDMLRRGIEDAGTGNAEAAVKELRIAAFGLIDDVAAYQTAQIHLALASEKLGRSSDARAAAAKFLQAERTQASYAGLTLDAQTRAAFEKIVADAGESPAFHRSVPQPVARVASVSPTTLSVGAAGASPADDLAQNRRAEAPTVTVLAAAESMMNEGRLLAAREAYAKIAQRADLSRADLLAAAKGLNRTSAFAESAKTYAKAQPFRAGEELHMFYEAVNRFELGELKVARTLLAKALPALERTREVEQYQTRIERGF
ncbi:MAG TPA: hypothetical protein VFN10_07155 [Thermoanaerobaculia bacterium]|nr:hypothetical protein [Thermoanaerobaculia bacterium]